MRVGTDGVLLGAWCQVPAQGRVLDIGTGTGLIALMLAQRIAGPFQADAVEIDPEAAAQAQANFNASPWASFLQVHATSLQAYQTAQQYQLIVSNPPFYNATLKPDDEARALARHKDALPIKYIMRFAAEHLTADGRLALVYPMEYDGEVMTAAVLAALKPVRLCNVITKEGKPCKRRLAEFSQQTSSIGMAATETLAIRNAQGEYSEEYRTLTDPFYVSLK